MSAFPVCSTSSPAYSGCVAGEWIYPVGALRPPQGGGIHPAGEEPYNTTSANRLHQLLNTMNSLRMYSPEELELAWVMSHRNGHHARYAQDSTGLLYLSGAVLSASAYRHLQLADLPNFGETRVMPVSPAGAMLDATA
ncbi:MAG: hypothetical protein R3C12_13950 [Planctomycetaceae bacterium]|nr:hypothetical protein [Planctomycetaceae bacterium]